MIKKGLPVIAIREGVVFPHAEAILTFGRPSTKQGIISAFQGDRQAVFVSQRDSRVMNPAKTDLYEVGTLGLVAQVVQINGEIHAAIQGLGRVKLEEIEGKDPFMTGSVVEVKETMEGDENKVRALASSAIELLKRAVGSGKSVDFGAFMKLINGRAEPGEIADQIAYYLELPTAKKQELLEMLVVDRRLEKVIEYMGNEVNIMELEKSISAKTQAHFEKQMREQILRERKKVIDKELQEISDDEEDGGELRQMKAQIKAAKMPSEVRKKAEKELDRLSQMSIQNPESSYIKTFLDWLVSMPWSMVSPNNASISHAESILDHDHYGLKKAKERILEFLAVMKLKKGTFGVEAEKKKKGGPQKDSLPTILCFVGPPGVGKTSLGRSIARALGRKFVRVSLGGIRDEAEIRGHRRTYVGAMPGRIIQGIKQAGTKNPVFMLDEIDKIGADFRGDPSSALLEALDPEQNFAFSDHYLEVPFDLSQVMFVTTANVLDTIPDALRDRLEVIEFPGYTEEEKFHIAKEYLWDKQLSANGLVSKKLKISDEAISEVIRRYTREAGVRDLERNFAKICRRLARMIAEGKKEIPSVVSIEDCHKFLGPQQFQSSIAEKEDEVGMATGMVWTQVGGDITFVEVALMPGKGQLQLTGKLGDVMKESAQAALSYIRSHWKSLGLRENFAKDIDVHIHVPEGAVPKDGPSAGITIATALVSAFTRVPVRREVAMTGEITLRGRVLEIGGLKEKVIAAHRAGIKTVIVPKENKKDLAEDIPANIKRDIKFVFVSHLDEVLRVALAGEIRKVGIKRARRERDGGLIVSSPVLAAN
ncbi:MAG: endopeptidase La [Deltaproteobacteria bacterium]|nr:endopeptidase La [Deltaproteobacteria bacterium]